MSKLKPDARKVTKLSYRAADLIADMIGGMFAGMVFKRVWSIIEHGEDVPRATDEQRAWRDILIAAGLQGAVFALVKAAIDRSTAQGTRKLTGIWPGAEGQQPGKPA